MGGPIALGVARHEPLAAAHRRLLPDGRVRLVPPRSAPIGSPQPGNGPEGCWKCLGRRERGGRAIWQEKGDQSRVHGAFGGSGFEERLHRCARKRVPIEGAPGAPCPYVPESAGKRLRRVGRVEKQARSIVSRPNRRLSVLCRVTVSASQEPDVERETTADCRMGQALTEAPCAGSRERGRHDAQSAW